MANLLLNFPPGPLDRYRKLASFDWKQLSLFLNGEEFLNYRNELYKEMLKYPVLLDQTEETPTLNELRRKTTQKMFALQSVKNNVISRTNCSYANRIFANSSTIYLIDPNTTVKCLSSDFFTNAIASMGTERHWHFIESSSKGDVWLMKEKYSQLPAKDASTQWR
ncbi:hypothetical protein ILUMI_18889 [Ignelater luminosus]|uniref:Uncharacterized protein n=1 Tax=Ignelater luminosus TaxID=2038154 RepID=A0A8K0CJ35_IGNLU|nr:hypothetical protein ILUMI_18889 [Ignelater luminosus]